jgi:hypothetical protein
MIFRELVSRQIGDKPMYHLTGLIVFTLLLVGCASSAAGPKFADSSFATQPVAADKGRIIAYRESDINYRAATFSIDGSIVGALSHRQFMVADITPGDHKVAAWARYSMTGEDSIDISVSPGETYYIRVSRRSDKSVQAALGPAAFVAILMVDRQGVFKLEMVPASIAVVDLEELNLSE